MKIINGKLVPDDWAPPDKVSAPTVPAAGRGPTAPVYTNKPQPVAAIVNTVGVSEASVGITHYTTEGTAWDCVIKHRFADFIVDEIDESKSRVRLTDLDGVQRLAAHGSAAPRPLFQL